MSELEFQAGVDEDIGMVKRGRRLPRKSVYFIPEEEFRRYKAMDAAAIEPVKDDGLTARQKNLARAGRVIAWVIPAVTFFVGAAEGLMNLYFAGVLAVPFLLLAVCCWLNK